MSAAAAPVLIAGAGIGGLALAIGLARRGLPVRILERRAELSEAGAGIQMGPNATRVLGRLGVDQALASLCAVPAEIAVHDGATGRRLGAMPLGETIRERHGSPYWVCHRADLQDSLAAAAAAAHIPIQYGFSVAHWAETPDAIEVISDDGRRETGTALIGADGLWSSVRRQLYPDHPLGFSGKIAARALAPAGLAPAPFARQATGIWMSPKAHVVHYPVRAGREIAIVVISEDADAHEGWAKPIEAADIIGRAKGFAPKLVDFLLLGSGWRTWSLYDPQPLPAWTRGRIALMGDAAHPVLPFLAQGGGMALEDADTLAELLAREQGKPSPAFAQYEALRRARVARVQDASRSNGRIFHMSGPMAFARNIAMALMPNSMMLSRYDWLYGWRGDVT